MAWAPFVEATIAMVRDHGHVYERGPGFVPRSAGGGACGATPSAPGEERYWTRLGPAPPTHRPYRVEVVGVTCDPALAVARGVWRRVRAGRSVPAAAQLRSHRLFAASFPRIAPLADSATLFHTGAALTTLGKGAGDLAPVVVAHASAATRGELLVSPAAWAAFRACERLNDGAASAAELWPRGGGVPERVGARTARPRTGASSTLRAVLAAADQRDVRAAEASVAAARAAVAGG
jgi:hypothetical protein